MKPRVVVFFFYCAGTVLLFAALAKLISSLGSARILQNADPIFAISFRSLFCVASFVESAVALVCFFSKRTTLQACLVAWLATSFLVYRLALVWIGYRQPCPCLGHLTDALHIPVQISETAMKSILAYLLTGSYAILVWLWWQKRGSLPSILPREAAA